VTVGEILFDAISWEGDAMTIHIGKMKNDQGGAHGFARHVYANPKDPLICPILSIGVLVLLDQMRSMAQQSGGGGAALSEPGTTEVQSSDFRTWTSIHTG
jgi:hypothetical protein